MKQKMIAPGKFWVEPKFALGELIFVSTPSLPGSVPMIAGMEWKRRDGEHRILCWVLKRNHSSGHRIGSSSNINNVVGTGVIYDTKRK